MSKELIQNFLINIVSSSIVVGLILFIFKRYLEKWISYEFDKRLKIFSSDLEREAKLATSLMEKQLGIYPEILEVVYRLRNTIREGMNQSHAYKWDRDLQPLCAHLTENLYKYRLFLPVEVFDALHKFKRIAQQALLFVDMQTRDDNLFEQDEYEIKLKKFKKQYEEAEVLYEQIVQLLNKKLNIK